MGEVEEQPVLIPEVAVFHITSTLSEVAPGIRADCSSPWHDLSGLGPVHIIAKTKVPVDLCRGDEPYLGPHLDGDVPCCLDLDRAWACLGYPCKP